MNMLLKGSHKAEISSQKKSEKCLIVSQYVRNTDNDWGVSNREAHV